MFCFFVAWAAVKTSRGVAMISEKEEGGGGGGNSPVSARAIIL